MKKNIYKYIFVVFIIFFTKISSVGSDCKILTDSADNDSTLNNSSTTGQDALCSVEYNAGCCGICKSTSLDWRESKRVWPHMHGLYAHRKCINLIRYSQSGSQKILKNNFGNNDYCMLLYHKEIIAIVDDWISQAGEFSIKNYYEKFGNAKLAELFNLATQEIIEDLKAH